MSSETSTKKEYKETLNLPQTTLAMRANATVRELEIQKLWEEIKVYEKNLAQRDKTNSFILLSFVRAFLLSCIELAIIM